MRNVMQRSLKIQSCISKTSSLKNLASEIDLRTQNLVLVIKDELCFAIWLSAEQWQRKGNDLLRGP